MISVDTKSKYSFKKVLREMSILRQLSSMKQNVFTTKLYDVIVSAEALDDVAEMKQLFLIMEHVEFDIRALFNVGTGGFSSDHATVVIYNLLCAMKFIHSAGLIHRDLKPANILIDSNCIVKLCDFGLSTAQLVEDNNVKRINSNDSAKSSMLKLTSDIRLTNISSPSKHQKKERRLSPAVQTRWYRSPEIILLEKSYDSQIDMWSLGCIFYELINFQDQDGQTISSKDRCLFTGDYCDPLSPKSDHIRDNNQKDQLSEILKAVGHQDSLSKWSPV